RRRFLQGILLKAVTTIARGIGLMDPRLYQMFGGGVATWSGEEVSIPLAMRIDTVWACVLLIAQTIATLPLQMFGTDEPGRGGVNGHHPPQRILPEQPDGGSTAVDCWI